ncbi:MAG: App1 family protein [Candidatus Sericytochromatia bacterium]
MKKIYKVALLASLAVIITACGVIKNELSQSLPDENLNISSINNEFSDDIEFDEVLVDDEYYKKYPDHNLANELFMTFQKSAFQDFNYQPKEDVSAQGFFDFLKKKATIDIYEPYSTTNNIKLTGRVYKKRNISPEQIKDSKFKNIIRTIKYYVPDPIEDVQVNVNVNGVTKQAKTDKKGFFSLDLSGVNIKQGVNSLKANLVTAKYKFDDLTQEYVSDKADTDSISIISDIDDTVKYTGVNHKIEMIKNVITGNSKTDKPYAGVSSLYKSILNGPKSSGVECMHYVSGSPAQLYRRIHDFFEFQKFPEGSIDLKINDTKLEEKSDDTYEYKVTRIRKIMKTYPNKKFFCFGDTTQKDTEVYVTIKKEFPDRVLGIYINNVNKFDANAPRFKEVKLTNTASEAAKDLLEQGYITQESYNKVFSEAG